MKSHPAMTGDWIGWKSASRTMETTVGPAHKYQLSPASIAMERRLTDRCAEMPSTPSPLLVTSHVLETASSAHGLNGRPVHTPAPERPPKEDRQETELFLPIQVMEAHPAPRVTHCKRSGAVMNTHVPYTTGRQAPGDSVQRTSRFRFLTLPVGTEKQLVRLECRQEKSFVFGSTLDKLDLKSAQRAFVQRP